MTTAQTITAALAILVTVIYIGYLARNAFRGAPEREAEEAARDHFDRHGRWPDEET
jgi:hypothetical protein